MAESDEIETGQTVPTEEFSPGTIHSDAPANDNQDEPIPQNQPPYPGASAMESSQARETTDTYLNYRAARRQRGHEWWGDKQLEPGISDPDRQFMFARNAPISDQEIQDAQNAYNDIIADPRTGQPNPLGPHLRPTTTPLERAKKQVQGLRDQGVEVPAELRNEIFDHFITNSGLYASLMEWCEGKAVVPVEHVREIYKNMDRLKLEMAKQLHVATEKNNNEDKKIESVEEEEADSPEKRDFEHRKTELELSVTDKGKQREATSPKQSPRPGSIPSPTGTSLDAPGKTQNSETSDANPLESFGSHDRCPEDSAKQKDEAKTLKKELQEANIEIGGLKEQIQERDTRIKRLEEQIKAKTDINELIKPTEQSEELEKKVESLRKQVDASQNRIKALEKVNFATADSLINAVRNQDNGTEALSLMDRINYLNLACFFRTRNYVQLAIREGADRLANILLYDASRWIKFCQDDFAKMDRSVYTQINVSMSILDGVRRVVTAKDQDAVLRGRRELQAGREALSGFLDTSPFMQLRQLADSIIEATQDKEGNFLYNKRLRFSFQKGFRVERKPKTHVQERLRNDRSMKTEELRRSGFHSPLSPEDWSNDNPSERFRLENINE